MKYEKNTAFSDWLYNRFVTSIRAGYVYRAPVYAQVLAQYISLGLNRTRHTIQKQHAENLLHRITQAVANNTTRQLKLTGREALTEKLNGLYRQENILRRGGIPEQDVQAILTQKFTSYAID